MAMASPPARAGDIPSGTSPPPRRSQTVDSTSSSNTDFEVTDAGHPRGYDKFDAYTILHHGGDFESAHSDL